MQPWMRWLLLGKKAMTNLGNVLKNRDITLYRQSSVQSSYGLPSCHLQLWELDHKEGIATKTRCLWMVVLDSLRVPWAAGRSNQSILRETTLNIHWKDWCWGWSSCILVTWCEQPTHWKSPWCWERLRAEGEEGVRRCNGWIASLMQWTWTWANLRRWWGVRGPDVLQSMGSQRVGHNWATEQQNMTCGT